MKDHEIREAINELRDIAIKYRDVECLREAIAPIVHSIVERCKPNMKKVDDLKIGDIIKIISPDLLNNKYGATNLAKITEIGQSQTSEEMEIEWTLHFEGNYKSSTHIIDLNIYQTEYEVVGECKRFTPKGSPNKETLTNPSDYSMPYCKDYDVATIEDGVLGEMKSIHKAIADIPDCDCLCENSIEKALLKLQLIKSSKYLASEEDTKWFMP